MSPRLLSMVPVGRLLQGLSVSVAAAVAMFGLGPFLAAQPAAASSSTTMFRATSDASWRLAGDRSSTEVGSVFKAVVSGKVTAIRFYKAPGAKGTHKGALWTKSGKKLAAVIFKRETKSGWQTAKLKKAVRLVAGRTYVVSYHVKKNGRYAVAANVSVLRTASSSALRVSSGVYRHNSKVTFPTSKSRVKHPVDVIYTPDPTPIPTPSPSPTPVTPGTPDPTTAPTPASGLLGWQLTAKNIGLAPLGLSCDSLPRYTGSLKPAAGARISGVRIEGNLDLSNGDIIVEKSCIRPASGDNRALVSNDICGAVDCLVTSAAGITIRDSEFDASSIPATQIAASCAFRGIGVLQRNYMHGMGSGICFFGTGFIQSGLAEQNYVTELRAAGSSHNEAATVRDLVTTQEAGRTVRFINNRLNCETGNDTGGLFIQPTWDNIANVYLQGNYIEGGGYNLFLNQAGGTYRNVHAVNNRFRPTGWGPSTVQGGPGWTEWSENYRYDPTKPGAKGAVVMAD